MQTSLTLVIVSLLVGGSLAGAAQQGAAAKKFLVKSPPSGNKKIVYLAKNSTGTVVGDPTAEGATFSIAVSPGDTQCITLPASGWAATAVGFKYKDSALTNGPVKVALIKAVPSGAFLLKVVAKGPGIAIAPGNPTTSYGTNFQIGAGEEYCGSTGAAVPSKDDAVTFLVKSDTGTTCTVSAASCASTTSTTTVSTTTSTSVASVCGNGMVEGAEECDDGDADETDGCTTDCVSSVVCDATAFPGGDDFAVAPSSGHCYVSFDSEQTAFASAQTSCAAGGGHLVTITDAGEDAVVGSVHNTAENPWIGAQDDGNDVDAVFDWVTAESWGYSRFAALEPDDDVGTDGNGECLHLTNAAGEWADTNCNLVGFVVGRICEYEP